MTYMPITPHRHFSLKPFRMLWGRKDCRLSNVVIEEPYKSTGDISPSPRIERYINQNLVQ